jgi:hypothetical protein
MQTQGPRQTDADGLEAALARLDDIVREGLHHGYFECVVSSETIKGKKRRLVIKAGKSYQFVIPVDDVVRSEPLR